MESAAGVHYQPTSSRPSRQAARALEPHWSWGFGGRFLVAAAPPAFCLHKLDLVQHIGLSGD